MTSERDFTYPKALCGNCGALLSERQVLDQVIIPEKDEGGPYPGDIQPGYYDIRGLVDLLRRHKGNPEAIQFIADMVEL